MLRGWPQPPHYPKERSRSLLCFPLIYPHLNQRNNQSHGNLTLGPCPTQTPSPQTGLVPHQGTPGWLEGLLAGQGCSNRSWDPPTTRLPQG